LYKLDEELTNLSAKVGFRRGSKTSLKPRPSSPIYKQDDDDFRDDVARYNAAESEKQSQINVQ
jgi:hypothetical protein